MKIQRLESRKEIEIYNAYLSYAHIYTEDLPRNGGLVPSKIPRVELIASLNSDSAIELHISLK